MGSNDQCLLEGGGYGRIDAPFLWFQSLKKTLRELGVVQCPFDACCFSLISPRQDGTTQVRGVLGIHVDDGLGVFTKAIERLRAIYSLGLVRKRSSPLRVFGLGNGMTAVLSTIR